MEDEDWTDEAQVWYHFVDAFFENDGDNWGGSNAEENLVEMMTTFFGEDPDADYHARAQELLAVYDNGDGYGTAGDDKLSWSEMNNLVKDMMGDHGAFGLNDYITEWNPEWGLDWGWSYVDQDAVAAGPGGSNPDD